MIETPLELSMSTPRLSLVTIARNTDELNQWKERLENQSYEDYEICYSTAGDIPTAWNEAISQAEGELILFTETDTHPIHSDWLETVVSRYSDYHEGVVHFGEFRGYNPFNFSNTAISNEVMQDFEVDDSYPVGEDSELFARMDKNGVDFDHDPTVPVYHEPKSSGKSLSRGFKYGRVKARTALAHGRLGPSTNTTNSTFDDDQGSKLDFFAERISQIAIEQLTSLLFVVGFGFEIVQSFAKSKNKSQ